MRYRPTRERTMDRTVGMARRERESRWRVIQRLSPPLTVIVQSTQSTDPNPN